MEVIELSSDDDDGPPPAAPAGKKRAREQEVIDLDEDATDVDEPDEAAASSVGSRGLSAAAGSSSAAAGSSAAHAATSWARPSAAITCPICMCEEEPATAVSLASCGCHFCEDCIKAYVREKVDAGNVMQSQLLCPTVEPTRCAKAIAPADIKRCLDTDAAAARYERLTLQRAVEMGDDMGTCPTAGCTFMFVFDKDNRKLECPMCSQSFCLVCRTSPWHRGVRCEQYQAENGDPEAADATFAAFAQNQKLKQCPKCTSWVEKTSGCDAMHCRCNLVFCYKCGGVLKSGHGSAKGTSIKECECAGVNQLLAAHEAPGVPNHNLMPQNQVAGAMAAAQAALQAAMQRGGRAAQHALAAAHAAQRAAHAAGAAQRQAHWAQNAAALDEQRRRLERDRGGGRRRR